MRFGIWLAASVCLCQAAIAFGCLDKFKDLWYLFIFSTVMFGLAFMDLVDSIIKAARETP